MQFHFYPQINRKESNIYIRYVCNMKKRSLLLILILSLFIPNVKAEEVVVFPKDIKDTIDIKVNSDDYDLYYQFKKYNKIDYELLIKYKKNIDNSKDKLNSEKVNNNNLVSEKEIASTNLEKNKQTVIDTNAKINDYNSKINNSKIEKKNIEQSISNNNSTINNLNQQISEKIDAKKNEEYNKGILKTDLIQSSRAKFADLQQDLLSRCTSDSHKRCGSLAPETIIIIDDVEIYNPRVCIISEITLNDKTVREDECGEFSIDYELNKYINSKNAVENLQTEINNLNSSLNTKQNENKTLNSKLTTLNNNMNNYTSEITKLNTNLTNLNNEKKVLETLISNLDKQITTSNSNIIKLENLISENTKLYEKEKNKNNYDSSKWSRVSDNKIEEIPETGTYILWLKLDKGESIYYNQVYTIKKESNNDKVIESIKKEDINPDEIDEKVVESIKQDNDIKQENNEVLKEEVKVENPKTGNGLKYGILILIILISSGLYIITTKYNKFPKIR